MENLGNEGHQNAPFNSTIAIPFRLEATEKDLDQAKGAYYDHYVTRAITGHPTALLKTDKMETNKLANYARQLPYNLSQLGNGINMGNDVPECQLENENIGLLLIPGMARKTLSKLPTHYNDRIKLESQSIKAALQRGQPILAICAGSWGVWKEMCKQGQQGNHAICTCIEEVKDHTASRMPNLRKQGVGVGYNIMIHDVKILKDTMLAAIMGLKKVSVKKDRNPDIERYVEVSVNSVHWMSPRCPSDDPIQRGVLISARSKRGNHQVKHRNGGVMNPEEDIVEAFESKYGAPILGVLWHIEAFYNNPSNSPNADAHLDILRYMSKAGDSYCRKRALLKELRDATLQKQELRNCSEMKELADRLHDILI